MFIVSLALHLGEWKRAAADESEPSREAVIAAMKPFDGKSAAGSDNSTLRGKVVCGYQGWFAAAGDGSGRGWRHYTSHNRFEPGSCSIDLWPDLSEFEASEKFPTAFRHADGRVAYVFNSSNRTTVLRHFQWMKEYAIDGVFVQRFGVETIDAGEGAPIAARSNWRITRTAFSSES